MDSKLSVLLLLAIAAQNSFAQNTSDSCVEATSIKADLATINNGQATALDAFEEIAEVTYNEIISILTDRSPRKHSNHGNADLRFELAKNESFKQLMAAVEAVMEGIKVFQTDLDVAATVSSSVTASQDFIGYIYSAINVTRVATNYTAAKAEIAAYAEAFVALGKAYDEQLFNLLLNGSTPVPEAAQPVTACVAAKAVSLELVAIESIADQINILLDAVFKVGTKGAGKRITAAYEKTRDTWKTVVRYKFSLIRNLVVGAYLENSTDIVTGLYDVLSTVPGYTSI